MRKVIVVVGPTAIGKTKIAIELAKLYNLEIISGDSVAVYKRLDIGSAKPTHEEQCGIVHHLIDEIDPRIQFSVYDFQQKARNLMNKVDVSLICGGTGLYIQSALFDYEFKAESRNEEFEKRFSSFSNDDLYDHLLNLDGSIDQSKLHPNNRKRILRAIEIMETTQKSISTYHHKNKALYKYFIVYLNLKDREQLYKRINQRVDEMIHIGLEKEVRNLYKEGITPPAIGYKEFVPYFRNECTLDVVIEEIKKNTRHLAKRQMTWFKNQMTSHFYEVDVKDYMKTVMEIKKDIDVFLEEE